jgi:Putative restriction endonuclease
MAALPDLITVEQFRQLAESGEFAYELHHGEVVAMTRPRLAHERLQRRLARLLEALLPSYEIGVEYAFRPVAESNCGLRMSPLFRLSVQPPPILKTTCTARRTW